jgi:hypothetical protein
MAQLIGLNVYQINSQTPIPLGSVQKFDFPFGGIFVRPINGAFGILLTTGVQCYSQVQLIATGTVYTCVETPAAIAALS